MLEQHFEVRRQDVFRAEFSVFVKLKFDLQVHVSVLLPHFNRFLRSKDLSALVSSLWTRYLLPWSHDFGIKCILVVLPTPTPRSLSPFSARQAIQFVCFAVPWQLGSGSSDSKPVPLRRFNKIWFRHVTLTIHTASELKITWSSWIQLCGTFEISNYNGGEGGVCVAEKTQCQNSLCHVKNRNILAWPDPRLSWPWHVSVEAPCVVQLLQGFFNKVRNRRTLLSISASRFDQPTPPTPLVVAWRKFRDLLKGQCYSNISRFKEKTLNIEPWTIGG